MKHVVNHDLGQERAKKVAESALSSYKEKFAKYSPAVNWVTPNKADIGFNVKGVSLKGALEVSERTIEMELDVPFLLRPFKGQALAVIESEINEWIAKAKSGAL
ncbi:MAG TPA: polyhydroxyalkanoic acid system family protein [Polyangiaceae bacterium]|nr:polyhydroxyalkanoic acid system family protein [Polyangiaceae bacterium]